MATARGVLAAITAACVVAAVLCTHHVAAAEEAVGPRGGALTLHQSSADAAAPAGKGEDATALRKKRLRHNKKLVEVPYVRLQPSEVRVTGGCQFKGCPSTQPFVYYTTSYRNRGASFNRWIRSVLSDVQSDVNTFPVQCLCIAVADYNDVVSGAPLSAALEDWPYDKAVISLHGNFSRAGGFQRAIDHLVTTPKTKSMVFFVDADMIAYPGLLNRIVKYTVQGEVRRVVGSSVNKRGGTRDGVRVSSLRLSPVVTCSPLSRPWCGPR